MHYHLTQKQRIELSLLCTLGYTQRAAAIHLGVSPSTVCRELIRNVRHGRNYHATYARMQTVSRRMAANQALRKLVGDSTLVTYIVTALTSQQWSPDQIAASLRKGRHALRVCAQTIYDWVYTCRTDLIQYLRSKKQKYRRTRANTLRKQQRRALFAARRIDKRPLGRRYHGE